MAWALRARAAFAVVLVVVAASAVRAEESANEKELRKELEEMKGQIRALSEQLQRQQELIEKLTAERQSPTAAPAEAAKTEEQKKLEAEIAAAMPTPTPGAAPPASEVASAAPQAQPAAGPGVGKSSSLMNPDISLNADVTFLGTDNRQLEKANEFSLREAEIGFQAPIDPYARADVFITFPEGESAAVEEGYATFLTLPYNLQARAGKFRLSFGKNNTLHLHALPQTDRPLAEVVNFGDDGVAGTGIGLSWLVPNPWDQYLLLTSEMTNGLGEEPSGAQGQPLDAPAPARSFGDFVYTGHAQSFFDFDPTNNVELGASILENDAKSGTKTRVAGFDLTYRWRPLDQSEFHQFLWRTEGYFTHLDTGAAGRTVFDTQGYYTYGEYRLSQALWIGNRVDWTEFPGTSGKKEWGVFPYFTYSPMEFGYVRLGYQFVRSDELEKKDSNRFWLQYNFSIGPHAAHAF